MADYIGRASGDTYLQPPAYSVQASRFQNTVGDGAITRIRVHYYAYQAGNIRLGVYADNAGAPAALLGQTGVTAMADGWVEVTGLNIPVTNNAYYWIAVHESDFNGSRALSSQGAVGEGSTLGMDNESFQALPDPFGTPDYSGTGQLVIQAYVDDEAGGSALVQIVNE